MKKLLKKFWWVIIVLVMPVAINFMLLIPVFSPIVGDEKLWLTFWSSYASALITAGITLFVLYRQLRQNHKENEDNRQSNRVENENNRKLQLYILRQQQENQWLDKFRQAALEYILVFNVNNLTKVGHMIGCNNPNYDTLLKEIFDNRSRNNIQLSLLNKQDSDAIALYQTLEKYMQILDNALDDIQEVVINYSNNPKLLHSAIDTLCRNSSLSEKMKKIIDDVMISYCVPGISLRSAYEDMIEHRIEDIKPIVNDVANTLRNYIRKEQLRIDRITDVE